MGILECISGAVRELFGATDEITRGLLLLSRRMDWLSPARAEIALSEEENSPNLNSKALELVERWECSRFMNKRFHLPSPSAQPVVVQDCNYRAEGAGRVVNRQRHGGRRTKWSLHCRLEEEAGCRICMERRRTKMQLPEFRHPLGENPVILQLQPWGSGQPAAL